MPTTDVIALLFSGVLTITYTLMIAYYYRGWQRLADFDQTDQIAVSGQTFVSIVVAARNEEANIRHCIEDLLDQTYPSDLYEIIIADDHSEDRTAEIVRSYSNRGVQLVSLKGSAMQRKKHAIESGVRQARGTLIITTDADCRTGNEWLPAIVSFYESNDYAFIAGPVSYFHDSSLLGKLQTLDLISLVGIAGSSIAQGFPNLCNGANLAYEKEAFIEVGGFEGIADIDTGDDMLLMHKIARLKKGNTGFLKSRAAIVYTYAEPTLAAFVQQRLRWSSKATYYQNTAITALLLMAYLFNLSILINFLGGFIEPFFWRLFLLQFLIKMAVDTLFQYPLARFFKKENILWLFLPIQILHIIYVIAIGPWSLFGSYTWKGRQKFKMQRN